MNKRLIILIISFLLFVPSLYSFDANISSSSKEIYLNQKFTLNLKIDLQDSDNININRIKGIENFEVLWKSQSQQSDYRTTIINWKADTISRQIINMTYVLKSKNAWEYTIWPFVLSDGQKIIETNTIDLKILNSFFDNKTENNKKENKVLYKGLNYNYILYFLLPLVLLTILIIYTYYKNREKLKSDIGLIINKFSKKNNINTADKFMDKKMDDFEKNQIIEYPKIDDQDFVIKIDNIVKQKLQKKYNIKGIKKLTYTQILENLDHNLSDREIVKNIFDMITKLKYSNILISKSQLVELIKKI